MIGEGLVLSLSLRRAMIIVENISLLGLMTVARSPGASARHRGNEDFGGTADDRVRGCTPMIRIGPAGWSYPDWKGRVYPAQTPREFDALTYLADYFDTIEINSTFYRTPDPTLTRRWAQRIATRPGFKFTVKLPQLFTHTRQARAQDEDAFKQAMDPLYAAGKLGAVLVQFPYAFHQTPANRAYLEQLAQRFDAYPLVLEVRHRSWDRAFVNEFLRALGVGFCNIDQPQVSYSLGITRRVTSAVGYMRLHGRNTAAWFQEDVGRDARYDYLYAEHELGEIAATVKSIAAQAQEIYLIANNHFRGQAVVNALQLRYQLQRTPVNVPPPLLTAYPELGQVLQPTTPSETAPRPWNDHA
jgi:uncharacterized protein YecE (DUF72 family)